MTTQDNSKRTLLKILSLGGSAIAASQLLPTQWTKPIVDVALLPAHAQSSPTICDPGLDVQMLWDGNTADVDLEMITPGGTRIAPKTQNGVLQGQCGLVHQGDHLASLNGNEIISSEGPSILTVGRYQLFVRSVSRETITFNISACGLNVLAEPIEHLSNPNGAPNLAGSINVSSGGTPTVRIGFDDLEE